MPEDEYKDVMEKPFRLGGRGPDSFDCWGLCVEIGKRQGIMYPFDFTPELTKEQSLAIQKHKDSDFVKIDKPEPFCIVTFKITPPFVDHCGIVLPDCINFIHIMEGHAATVTRLDHKIFSRRLDGFYKLRT